MFSVDTLIDEVIARILKSQFALEKAQSWPRSGTDTEYPAFSSLRCLTKAVGKHIKENKHFLFLLKVFLLK